MALTDLGFPLTPLTWAQGPISAQPWTFSPGSSSATGLPGHMGPQLGTFFGRMLGDQPWVSMSIYGNFSSVTFVNEANLLKPTALFFYINIYILSRQKKSFLVSSVLH